MEVAGTRGQDKLCENRNWRTPWRLTSRMELCSWKSLELGLPWNIGKHGNSLGFTVVFLPFRNIFPECQREEMCLDALFIWLSFPSRFQRLHRYDLNFGINRQKVLILKILLRFFYVPKGIPNPVHLGCTPREARGRMKYGLSGGFVARFSGDVERAFDWFRRRPLRAENCVEKSIVMLTESRWLSIDRPCR